MVGSIKVRKKIGIVGHEEKKFTSITKKVAKYIIRTILTDDNVLVSGGCHLGGIDIWSEEIADEIGIPKIIHYPRKHEWSGGYRERNLKIAKDSEIVYVIVVKEYPEDYDGMRFSYCYHCKTANHIKSGGCWTGRKAIELYNKKAIWYIIKQNGDVEIE